MCFVDVFSVSAHSLTHTLKRRCIFGYSYYFTPFRFGDSVSSHIHQQCLSFCLVFGNCAHSLSVFSLDKIFMAHTLRRFVAQCHYSQQHRRHISFSICRAAFKWIRFFFSALRLFDVNPFAITDCQTKQTKMCTCNLIVSKFTGESKCIGDEQTMMKIPVNLNIKRFFFSKSDFSFSAALSTIAPRQREILHSILCLCWTSSPLQITFRLNLRFTFRL